MANQNITASIILDVYDYDAEQPSIKAIAGDSTIRYVSSYLTDRGDYYDVDGVNTVAELIVLRPDKTVVIGNAGVSYEQIMIHPEYIPQERTVIDDEGVESTEYYYIDENGNEITVDSLDPIPADYEDRTVIYGELSKEMLAISGAATGQFKIINQNQILHTSFFTVNIGKNLEDQGSYIAVEAGNRRAGH